MKEKIMNILELGFKDDGNSFYSNEEKAELLYHLYNEENKKAFNIECNVGYIRGEIDDKTHSNL